MRRDPASEAGTERVLPAFVLALLLLAPPAMRLWAQANSPWWLVFAVWALLIALIGYSNEQRR